MSYLVLARKYRPQTFDEIVGQEHVTRTLANAFAKGRVHHAFLFCGARGVGKTTAARVLAKALCCEKGPTPEPCGTCAACTTITSGTAVDYFEIDGASNNSVDDIRELRDGVRYQPAQLRRKIYVIDEVHMLSVAAFNALLKTLEEPPPHVTFIFATTEVHKIPITILSRCQRYDFKLVGHRRLESHLEAVLGKEGIPVDKGALALLAREAGGSVRDALSLTDQVIAYAGGETITEARVAEVLGVADRALLVTLLRAVVEHDPGTALAAVDAAVGRGVDLSHLARTFLGALRDLSVVQSVQEPESLVDGSADDVKVLRELAKAVSRPQLMALFDRFARACEDMKESQTPRLLVEVALIDMAGSEPLAPVSDLVDRLEGLEKRLRSGAPASAAPRPSGPRPQTSDFRPQTSEQRPPPEVQSPKSKVQSPKPEAPPPKTAYRPPDDPMAAWEQAILAWEKKSLLHASPYLTARLLSWDAKGIELGVSGEGLNRAAEPENIARLRTFLEEHLGAKLDVKVKTVAPAAQDSPTQRSVAEIEYERRLEDKKVREEEARKHPLTEAVLNTFGAQIKEIKVDG